MGTINIYLLEQTAFSNYLKTKLSSEFWVGNKLATSKFVQPAVVIGTPKKLATVKTRLEQMSPTQHPMPMLLALVTPQGTAGYREAVEISAHDYFPPKGMQHKLLHKVIALAFAYQIKCLDHQLTWGTQNPSNLFSQITFAWYRCLKSPMFLWHLPKRATPQILGYAGKENPKPPWDKMYTALGLDSHWVEIQNRQALFRMQGQRGTLQSTGVTIPGTRLIWGYWQGREHWLCKAIKETRTRRKTEVPNKDLFDPLMEELKQHLPSVLKNLLRTYQTIIQTQSRVSLETVSSSFSTMIGKFLELTPQGVENGDARRLAEIVTYRANHLDQIAARKWTPPLMIPFDGTAKAASVLWQQVIGEGHFQAKALHKCSQTRLLGACITEVFRLYSELANKTKRALKVQLCSYNRGPHVVYSLKDQGPVTSRIQRRFWFQPVTMEEAVLILFELQQALFQVGGFFLDATKPDDTCNHIEIHMPRGGADAF